MTPKPARLGPHLAQDAPEGSGRMVGGWQLRQGLNWDIQLSDPQALIFDELADRKTTQGDVAITYALIIRDCGDAADWPQINRAIIARWEGVSALCRIKEKAWSYLELRP